MADINLRIGIVLSESIKQAKKTIKQVNKVLEDATKVAGQTASSISKLGKSYSNVKDTIVNVQTASSNYSDVLKQIAQKAAKSAVKNETLTRSVKSVNKIYTVGISKLNNYKSNLLKIGKNALKVKGKVTSLGTAINKLSKTISGKLKNNISKGISALKSFGNRLKKTATDSSVLKIALGSMLGYIGGTVVVNAFSRASYAIKDFLSSSVTAASDAEEIESKFKVVYSSVAKSAEKSMRTLANSYGLSKSAAKEMLGDTGDLLSGFGFTGEMALDLSTKVQKLGVDLASFTNYSGGAKGASEALTKALLGEREQVKMLGIAILEEDVKRQMAINTANGVTFATERQAKAYATLDLALAQSKNAIGDYARTQDGYANVQRRFENTLQDISIAVGTHLIPSLGEAKKEFIEFAKANEELFKRLGKVAGRIAKSLVPVFTKLLEKLPHLTEEVHAFFSALGGDIVSLNKVDEEIETTKEKILSMKEAISDANILDRALGHEARWKASLSEYETELTNLYENRSRLINQGKDTTGFNPFPVELLNETTANLEVIEKKIIKIAEPKKVTFKATADFKGLNQLETKLENVGKKPIELLQEERTRRLAFLDETFTAQGKNSERYKAIREKIEEDFKTKKLKLNESVTKARIQAEKSADKAREIAQKEAFNKEKERIKALADYRKAMETTKRAVVANVGAASNVSAGLGQVVGQQTPEAQQNIDNQFDMAAQDLQSGRITQVEFDARVQNLDELQTQLETSSKIGFGAGLANSITKGAEGAGDVLKAGLAVGATAILGPLGGQVTEALGPLLDVFMQGPEATKQMVADFMKSIPKLISNLIQSAATFGTELTKQVPNMIKGFIAELPNMVQSFVMMGPELVEAMIETFIGQLPKLVIALVRMLYKQIPAMLTRTFKNLGKKIIDGLKDALKSVGSIFKKLFKFKGGGKGTVEKFIHLDFPFVKFAKGGIVGGKKKAGPDSETNDKVPALLSEGEIVVPKSVARGPLDGIMDYLTTLGVEPVKMGFGRQWKKFTGGASKVINVVKDTALSGWQSINNITMQITKHLSKIPLVGRVFEKVNEFQELIASLLKLGFKVDIAKFIKNPKEEAKRIIREGKEILEPNFKKMIKPAGFKDGGLVKQVPSGYPNDTFPARLSTNELVVDRSTTTKLKKALDLSQSSNPKSDVDMAETNDLLKELLAELRRPQQIRSDVKVNQRAFAKIMLDIDRNNMRVTA